MLQELTPREDGRCVDCSKRAAVTRDGLFCKSCLLARIEHDNPIPECNIHEDWDRPSLASDMIDLNEIFEEDERQ